MVKGNAKNLAEFYKGFRKHFPDLNEKEYVDKLYLALPERRIVIDLMKLDEYLAKKYKIKYTKNGVSMQSFLTKKISKEAYEFVKKYI